MPISSGPGVTQAFGKIKGKSLQKPGTTWLTAEKTERNKKNSFPVMQIPHITTSLLKTHSNENWAFGVLNKFL